MLLLPNMLGDVGMGNPEDSIDKQCREDKFDETLQAGHCCDEGKFRKHKG